MRGRKMSEKRLKEKTASGLLWGAVNNLSTQVLMALIGIVLGRLLSPGEYGIVGMLAIFTAIAGSLQESGFTAALTNLKQATHREYNAVFWFSTTVSLSLYLILYLSLCLALPLFPADSPLLPSARTHQSVTTGVCLLRCGRHRHGTLGLHVP